MKRNPNELRSRLSGLIGFGVTPFDDGFNVDDKALRQNASNLAEICDVVVPLGNNGEIFSLSPEEQVLVGRAVVEEVRGRKPVLVGVGFSLPTTKALAQAAEQYGADGVLVLPPHITDVGDNGLFEYYRSIASAVKIGVVLFQTPSLSFSPSLLCRLSAIPNILGMKDEHGDMKQFVRQWEVASDRMELICGTGEILAPSYFALGVKSFTSGLVNFMPEIPVNILRLLREGKFQEAAVVVEKTLPIFALRRKCPGYTTSVIKEAMSLWGCNAGPVRPPLAPILPADKEELREILHRLGLLK